MEATVINMNVLADWLSNAGTVLTSIFTWLGQFVTFVTTNPFIWIPMIIAIVSAVVLGIGKSLIRG